MKRIHIDERPGWKAQAEALGFGFHTMYGEPYWDETRAYVFSLREIEEDIEDVSTELYALCIAAVDVALSDERWMRRLAIPETHWDWIRNSWVQRAPSLYGRFDLAYDGTGPAKMLEFNADTPTALYETGYYQWIWFDEQGMRGVIPERADQFNSVQDKLVARLGNMFEAGSHIHFACCKGTDEDRATVHYLEDCAKQAGHQTHFVYVEDIGVDDLARFADSDAVLIDNLFKLYPYEDMFREEYGPLLPRSKTTFIEPPWKAILSNKGILPLLWTMAPGHPNLLETHFEQDVDLSSPPPEYVRKPLFSREGANVSIKRRDGEDIVADGEYGEEGFILQAYARLPTFGDDYTVIGSWIVGDEAAGIGIREDKGPITRNLSRFVPHIILD